MVSRDAAEGAVLRELRLPRGPSWISHAFAALALAYAVYAFSVPGSYFFAGMLAFWVWAIVCAVWLIRLLVAAVLRRTTTFRRVGHWLVTPVVAVLAFTIVQTGAPLRVRFELSHGAMDSTARAVIAGTKAPRTVRRIGFWDVTTVERIRGGMRFLVADTGFLDPAGFAYSPNGTPEVIGEDYYAHYAGPWYIWEESW